VRQQRQHDGAALHYHLQNTATFGKSEGLPTLFLDYVADGKDMARGEPVKGQTIRPRTEDKSVAGPP
jgi:hypothetical protein